MDIEQEVVKTLRSVLSLDARKHPLGASSPLLGSIAELDSMAVVSILTAFEERFGCKVVDAFDASESSGVANIDVDGLFVDYPVAARSRQLIQLAEQIGMA